MTKKKEYKFVLPDSGSSTEVIELRPELVIDADGDLRLRINGVLVCRVSKPDDDLPLQLWVHHNIPPIKEFRRAFNLEELFND